MSESIEHIKNFNIGDRVTSNTSIMLDRGFRGVTGTIRTIVKDEADSWQYLIDLDDGRELQCDDWHLEQTQINDNQQIVLDWLKENYNHKYSKGREVFWALSMFTTNSMYEDFSKESVGIAYSKLDNWQFAQVLEVFSKWAQEQEED